ncbi:MAG: DUF885 domain-containing protein [Candidatus Zixiibacteriota bacterium]
MLALRRWGVIVLFAFVIAAPLPAANKKKAPSLSDLSQEILESLQAFYPVTATEMGIHTHDKNLADYSQASVKTMINRLKQYEMRLRKFEKLNLSAPDKVNYKLIKSNVDVALLNLGQIEWHKKSPQLYVDDAVNGLYFLVLSRHASNADKLGAILARMRAVPNLFAVARANLRSVPGVYIDVAKESLQSGMEFYRDVATQLSKEFPGRAGEISSAASDARDAMTEFIAYLASLPPGPEKGYAIGKDNFSYLLSHQYFLSYDADSLLKLGEKLLDDAQKAYRDFESYVELNHQNGQDSVFIPKSFTRQDIHDYYAWEVDQLKTFLTMNDIVHIPHDIVPVDVVETPPFLRSMIAGIAYQPAGPFDKEQRGIFYVRPIPDSLDREQLDARYRYVHRRGFRGSVVHEAFPGHHLQMQLAARNIDPVRKWQMNSMMLEGWALYCEEMVYRAGLYGQEDPTQWLGTLGGIRFRAARIVADVKLHTGEFSYDECVEWMIKTLDIETESSEDYIRREVRRYTLSPTVQMSYLIGKLEIQRLKDATAKKEGVNFSERAFYDKLLSEGSIPPTLLWEIMGLTPDGTVSTVIP